jgi:hypothetical protein
MLALGKEAPYSNRTWLDSRGHATQLHWERYRAPWRAHARADTTIVIVSSS